MFKELTIIKNIKYRFRDRLTNY